ncbi:hypothetical protein AAC387_Pa05g0688 [Persea americana]
MPVFDMIETVLVKKLHFTLGLPLHLIFQDPYMLHLQCLLLLPSLSLVDSLDSLEDLLLPRQHTSSLASCGLQSISPRSPVCLGSQIGFALFLGFY